MSLFWKGENSRLPGNCFLQPPASSLPFSWLPAEATTKVHNGFGLVHLLKLATGLLRPALTGRSM